MIFLIDSAMAALGALFVYLVRRPAWGELRAQQAPPPAPSAAALATAA